MTREAITRAARRLRDDNGIVSPEQLCEIIDACLCPVPMGKDPNSIKGFVQRCSRVCTVVVNSDLPEELQAIVEYHEIGHIVLRHYESQSFFRFQEFSLFDGRSEKENEANTFVAEYLLDDETAIQHLRQYQDIFSAAASLQVPPEILAFKARMLKHYHLISADVPITVNSSFMGKIRFTRENHRIETEGGGHDGQNIHCH